MSILGLEENIKEVQSKSIVEFFENFNHSFLNIRLGRSLRTSYYTHGGGCVNVELGHNENGYLREIDIDYTVSSSGNLNTEVIFKHWNPDLNFGRTMYRVRGKFYGKLDKLLKNLPSNIQEFDSIMDEHKYESEFNNKSLEDLSNTFKK